MSDLVGKHRQEASLTSFLKVPPVNADRPKMGFPGFILLDPAVSPPAVDMKVLHRDMDLKSGAGFAVFSNPYLVRLTASQHSPALEITGGTFPRRPSIGDPPAPRLTGALECGLELWTIPNFGATRERSNSIDSVSAGPAAQRP